ncbi:MAG: ABC transporter permease [Varibaculum sp.]|nr:ABC transporter permease [Varibaculum sp.]
MNNILGALTEAWEEVKINRMRVSLSLIGVGAAVWALATTLALGQILVKSTEELFSIGGRPGLIVMFAAPNTGDPEILPADGYGAGTIGDAADKQLRGFSLAAASSAEKIGTKYWSRFFSTDFINGPEICDDSMAEGCYTNTATLYGVDPMHFTLKPTQLVTGRLLRESDGELLMNPVVVNQSVWDKLGRPALSTHPQLLIDNNSEMAFTIVGVVEDSKLSSGTQEAYTHADTFTGALNTQKKAEMTPMAIEILGHADQVKEDSKVVEEILGSQLGKDYELSAIYDDKSGDTLAGVSNSIMTVISGIGGIVILIGALGLLTVSIVTVQQRIREIGIRRAVGASAARVFFSVFLESVVATTVAGVAGVMMSVLTIKLMPQEGLQELFGVAPGNVPYPMGAAFAGVAIAAGVGALCGIIPATIAVRKKPIDAIRF